MPKPREYGTPVGIPGGPSEAPSGDKGRPKPTPPDTDKVRAIAESKRLWGDSSSVQKRVKGSSVTPRASKGSNPILDRIIDEQSR